MSDGLNRRRLQLRSRPTNEQPALPANRSRTQHAGSYETGNIILPSFIGDYGFKQPDQDQILMAANFTKRNIKIKNLWLLAEKCRNGSRCRRRYKANPIKHTDLP